MPRGMWRRFEETSDGDRWWARVELSRGEWADWEMAAYDRDGLQPPFWQLPLEEDYFNSIGRDSFTDAQVDFESNVVFPSIIAWIVAGGALVAVAIAVMAVLAQFNLMN